jgi:hypothetical protein
MDIALTTNCPHCGKKLFYRGEISLKNKDVESSPVFNKSYDLAMFSSRNAITKDNSFLDGVYNMKDSYDKKMNAIDEGNVTINTFFKDLFFDVKAAKEPAELKIIQDKVDNLKIRIIPGLSQTFDENKEKLSKIIDIKMLELEKEKKIDKLPLKKKTGKRKVKK